MKKLLTLLLAFAALPLFAQNNFQPGYFIANDGTTTTCLIKNLAWKNNPTTFEYKTIETSATQTASLNQVSEFKVSSYKFVKFTVNIDRSPNDISNLSVKREPEFKQETLFLKVLVEGKATLYQYEDGNLVRYFYSGGDKNAPTEQLVFKEYKSDVNIAANNLFRGQLFEALKGNTTGTDAFKNIKYSKDPLVKLFLEYNNQSDTATNDLSASQNKAAFKIKITAGANLTSLSVYNSDNVRGAHDFDSGLAYRFGAELEIILPFNNKKWSLFADPNYYTYSDESTEIINVSSGAAKTWKIKNKGVELPFGGRHYMFLNDKSKLFIDAAYVLAIPLGNSNVSYQYNLGNAAPGPEIEISKSANFCIGAGFSYDKYSVELRYGSTRQLLNNYVLWGADYSTLGLILSYSIL